MERRRMNELKGVKKWRKEKEWRKNERRVIWKEGWMDDGWIEKREEKSGEKKE